MLRLVVILNLALLAGLPAAAETFELSNGDKVSGDVVETTDEVIILQSPLFGRVEIPLDQIVVTEEKVDTGAFGTGWFRGWTRRLSFGAGGAGGNTESAAVNGGLLLATEDDSRRWKFEANYNWSSSDGDTDTDQAFALLERDWKFDDSSFYLFGRTGYDYDSFRSFVHRVSGNAGVGYWWLEWPWWKFGTRLGAGVSYQWKGDDQVRPEAVGGIDSIWTIAEGHTFEIHADIFPDLADIGEFRTRETADWRIAITEVIGLSAGVMHQYVSDSTLDPNDITYQASVTYDF